MSTGVQPCGGTLITPRTPQLSLQPAGCRQPFMLSSRMRVTRLPASAHPRCAPSAPSSWRPARQATLPHTSTQAFRRGADAFSAATRLQQQQYVRHVQQDLPGTRQQPSQSQQQWPQQWRSVQVEARNRGKNGNNSAEPVFSYTQLFEQDMTPTATAAVSKQRVAAAQQSNKGFGKSSSRKATTGTAPPAKAAAVPGKAHVKLCITRHVEFGQNMRVTGSGEQMGAWNADNGPKLTWNDGDKWTADVLLPAGGYEFKFLLEHRHGHLEWENGNNRSFTVPKTAAELQVEGQWGNTQDTEVLELQQQLQQLQQQDEQLEAAQRDAEATERAQAAAFAAANKAAAAAYQQQAEAEAAAERMSGVEVSKPVVARAPPAAPADLFKIDLSLLDSDIPGHQQLMQVLMGFRQDMVEGLTGVTSTMMEIQEDLALVQQQMSHIATERYLGQVGPVDEATAAALESGAAVPWNQGPADTAAIIAADAAVSQEQAMTGLRGVLDTWQQELQVFREDSHGLRDELENLRFSLERQMADNTAAVHDLELLVKQLLGMEPGSRSIDPISTAGAVRPASVIAASAVAPARSAQPGSSRANSPGSSGPPGSAEMLDQEDKMLLERINLLASDLSEEMKEAVQELELQQQSLLERHQHIIADLSPRSNNNNRMALDLGFGPGLGMRMQPTVGAGGSQAQAGVHVMVTVARWLESRDVQQYYQGLLVALMVSCGLWRDSMWDELQAGALRATYKSYKSVWSDAALQTWKDNITTKQALLTAVSTGRQQLLSMHILWSLQELASHCRTLQDLLPEVATPIELGLMQKLRQKGGAGQGWALGVTGAPQGGGESAAAAQCAVLLQRWLAASDGGEGKW